MVALVIVISMIKDYIEDRRRRKADEQENLSKTKRLILNKDGDGIEQETVTWQDIKTGDIVIVENNQYLPADLVMLRSSAPKNICYIETKSLDGETNLKEKFAPKPVFERFKTHQDLETGLKGTIKCEAPHD